VAIEQALTILSWYEHLPKNEVPPERIWADPQGLDEWWETVHANRGDALPSAGSGGEATELVGNDLARTLKD
jgi:hypothetical protein